MSALDELLKLETDSYSPLQGAIVFLYGTHPQDAESAAAELAALRAENERLTARLQAAEGLVEDWRNRASVNADWVLPTDRQIGMETCAEELAAALQAEGVKP